MRLPEDQKKEILLHVAMKHENVVEVKDIVKEIPPTPPGQPPNTRPMLIVRTQSGFGRSIGQHVRSSGTTYCVADDYGDCRRWRDVCGGC
jgi:hypothetical protein